DAGGLQHSLGQAPTERPEPAHVAQEPGRPAFDTTDLRAAEVLRLRAEAARFVPNMHSDLLQLVVEDAHQPTVPARPDAAGQVLRRHGVIGALDLDVAVAVDDSPCLVEARE